MLLIYCMCVNPVSILHSPVVSITVVSVDGENTEVGEYLRNNIFCNYICLV